MKRVASIQDISCIGKCSLTVALPIISAMGAETAVIPTAVLSTHTAFDGFTFRDLTDDMESISDHWVREKFHFDAIYTGYLGSFRQLEIVSKFFDEHRSEDTLVIADPAMGDYGTLYKGFTPEFALSMGKLCGKADIIVPNLTEAAFMLGEEYPGDEVSLDYVRETLKKLCSLGAKTSVLTGVSDAPGRLGVMAYDSVGDRFFSYYAEKLDARYHGTGDVFASTFAGAMVAGFGLERSLQIAVDYTVMCIRLTMEDPNGVWYGVNFEEAVPYLLKLMGK